MGHWERGEWVLMTVLGERVLTGTHVYVGTCTSFVDESLFRILLHSHYVSEVAFALVIGLRSFFFLIKCLILIIIYIL